ncbi:MAG: type II toxin-antitoxin system VapC family toxin [Actinobacteria bacterium]|nr:type II toxin-antitoxin system VapC family toxin [Actinomycetota bacterium]
MRRRLNLLLDTSVFIWWVTADERLGTRARAAMADPASSVFVSAVSAWEIAIKRALGKLDLEGDVGDLIEREEFEELPIRVVHALAAESLPPHHRDPFDRMLIAQSRREGMLLVSGDRVMTRYDVKLLPAHA